jgi:hypothetical protein
MFWPSASPCLGLPMGPGIVEGDSTSVFKQRLTAGGSNGSHRGREPPPPSARAVDRAGSRSYGMLNRTCHKPRVSRHLWHNLGDRNFEPHPLQAGVVDSIRGSLGNTRWIV